MSSGETFFCFTEKGSTHRRGRACEKVSKHLKKGIWRDEEYPCNISHSKNKWSSDHTMRTNNLVVKHVPDSGGGIMTPSRPMDKVSKVKNDK